ncbi:MAG: M12 family metallo-peptidase [Bacteroidota bacterium]|nr:M12 family metallo-peptidase [Bacteroidota bacterium]MDP3146747.1 M12 family metallo-peptidase [Bacteroidota bacterium]
MKKTTLLLSISLLFSASINAQSNNDKFWSPISESAIKQTGKRQIVPNKYLAFQLNANELKIQLSTAPHENNVRINESTCIVSLPLPNGTIQKFKVVESPIMEQGLAAQFPDIKTYSVKGIDDVYANGKLDWNEFGFHGMVRSINGDFFIDPYCVENVMDYITYYTADFVKDPSQRLPEVGVLDNTDKESDTTPKKKEGSGAKTNSAPPATCVGAQLRTYRLAVACTGEYAVAATGFASPTIAQTLAKIVTSVNRVDGVYETEVAVRLVLVATETNVIYTVAATDPFTGNNNATTLIGESQTVITSNIGTANFDIGHTFSTGGGGLAGLGVVCNATQKARGITGSPSPVGDPYDIDYVAHEVGHQFKGNHTFNSTVGSCGGGNRNASTAVEPGSGITIMAYAGICGSQDLAPNSIAYFHAISYDEIVNFTNISTGNACAANTASGNNPPVVTGSGNYIVPKSTAFMLTGSATDPNSDPLTYSWEETDLGVSGNWNSGNKVFFRSYAPTTSPTRSFPSNAVVLTGNYTGTKGEYVPATAQTLQFRLTARDNKMGGGGVCYAINSVTIDNSGPLTVTNPNIAGLVWGSGTPQTITWAVNGTNAAPVSCDTVRILISYNSGTTYSVLSNSTPNDGTELITAPTVTANITTCRIKIEAKGNIFYDVSNFNFEISINVGLNQLSKNNPVGLSVWPNPFTNQISFAAGNLNSESITDVKIMDVLGKTVFQTKYNNKTELNETLDISNVSAGLYFISVTNNNKQSVYRIVKN